MELLADILLMLIISKLGVVVIVFPIVWLIMRRRDGRVLKVSMLWLTAGFFLTTFILATIQFALVFVGLDKSILQPGENLEDLELVFISFLLPGGEVDLFFSIVLPVSVAVGVCVFLRTKVAPVVR